MDGPQRGGQSNIVEKELGENKAYRVEICMGAANGQFGRMKIRRVPNSFERTS